jgi:hypothetical protein
MRKWKIKEEMEKQRKLERRKEKRRINKEE